MINMMVWEDLQIAEDDGNPIDDLSLLKRHTSTRKYVKFKILLGGRSSTWWKPRRKKSLLPNLCLKIDLFGFQQFDVGANEQPRT
ncbi:hypothetical protein F2Q69_00013873 [Brassica cretica]|uniref:Uncharacterized protein n=1 Tax=Brassica cretica TaxID=69181 RepID=A0A8S9QSV8_BRACR|nr:hypothetical protein F2Q69_00013873 [Brassica cretica]